MANPAGEMIEMQNFGEVIEPDLGIVILREEPNANEDEHLVLKYCIGSILGVIAVFVAFILGVCFVKLIELISDHFASYHDDNNLLPQSIQNGLVHDG